MHGRFLLFVITVLVSLGAAAPAQGDLLLFRAASAAKAGRAQEAATLYAGWLDLNHGAPGSARVFLPYFSVEQDFRRLVAESQALLGSAVGFAGADAAFLRIARLFDVAGRVQEARDAYLAALGEGEGDALIPAGLLSVEMNDLATFHRVSAGAGGQRGAALMAALDLYAAGDKAAGASKLIELAGSATDPDLALKALWILSGGGQDSQIVNRFAGSPEAAIASTGAAMPRDGADVTLAASPAGMAVLESLAPAAPPVASPAADSPAAPPVAESAPIVPDVAAAPAAEAAPVPTAAVVSATTPGAAQPAPAALPRYAIQAGSFQVKENADELSTALGRASFAAAVAADPDGKHWKVFVGTGMDADGAKALLVRLQKAGYSGFVTAEKAVTPPSSAAPSG